MLKNPRTLYAVKPATVWSWWAGPKREANAVFDPNDATSFSRAAGVL